MEEGLVVSVWIHEKGRSGQKNDVMRGKFRLRFNKCAHIEDDSRKLEKKHPQLLLCQIWNKGKVTEVIYVLVWRNQFTISQKIHEYTICRILDSKSLQLLQIPVDFV